MKMAGAEIESKCALSAGLSNAETIIEQQECYICLYRV